jgi:hypothetical protein
MRACSNWMAGADTSVRVSRQTLHELERLRRVFDVQTADETIQKLIRERRSKALSRIFGNSKGASSPFTEADRLDSHY